MNYLEFYSNAQRRLSEALLSMWASGQEANRNYFKQLLLEEPLLAEPVFQATFPWEASSKSFGLHSDIFDDDFIKALDKIKDPDFRFPKDRSPYIHQTESWRKLLNDHKSIVVTSGTGSGKTECFMIPVLQDLLRQKKAGHQSGVQAIFLYPLNALMNSQQKRMKAWCEALSPKITFAIYNGNTPENINQLQANAAYPEIVSRNGIREIPPQILFTNPTMLEYMLVRKSDQKILNQSQGKLRWILLDETHTYSGSAAAELSMQIRRILDAFGVTVNQVRFAATSATIGSDSENQLKQFIEQLSGKSGNEIVAINGYRTVPLIEDQLRTDPIIDKLRLDLNNSPALSATEIGRRFKPDATVEESLEIIDKLGDKVPGLIQQNKKDALLPTRAHFFVRSIGGIFVCTNPQCTRHIDSHPLIGSMTTHIRTLCDSCGAPLLELTSCNSCGNHLLVAEKERGNYPAKFRLSSKTEEELFEIIEENDDLENQTENDGNENSWSKIVLAKGIVLAPSDSCSIIACGINTADTTIVGIGNFSECIHNINGNNLCPHCGDRTDKLIHFRTSTTFLSRILSTSLLEQAQPMLGEVLGRLWNGRKYIAFTDNRQGTAKSALSQNTEVERNWIRTAVFHYLANKKRENIVIQRELTEVEQTEYNAYLTLKGKGIVSIEEKLQKFEEIKNGSKEILNPTASLNDLYSHLIVNSSLKSLFQHIGGIQIGDYLKALLIDQFGKRPRKANSPETMGFIKVVYPRLNECSLPLVVQRLGWSDKDWKDFLKICIDFFVRYNTHLVIPMEIIPFITQEYYSNNLYEADSDLVDTRGRRVKRWPSLNIYNNIPLERQHRLILLLCATMGINDVEMFSPTDKDIISEILTTAWRQLTSKILSKTDDENSGYKLNLFENDKVSIELLEKAWLCPVTCVPMDTIFRGFSPMIKGNINKANFERYKVEEELNYPYFPYANKEKKDEDGNAFAISDKDVIDWSNTEMRRQRELGLWSNLHERILLHYPIYLAAEHSAQQNKNRLQKIEEQFNAGQINILSCSTTMEMGVDIGGISEVVMNNVPPKPANYLQRAGRAGRRSEAKAMAVTFCAPNPIGTNVMNHPKWAMTHPTAMPIVKLESGNLIQRHINSFLLAAYIATIQGADVRSNAGDFFYIEGGNLNNFRYDLFRDYLNGLLVDNKELIRDRYEKIVAHTIKDSVSFQYSIEASLASLEEVFIRLNDRRKLLDDSEKSLIGKPGYSINSPEIKAIDYQRKQLTGQNLLGYFAENDFIPSAGIPTGIVDFHKKTYVDKINKENKTENNYFNSNPSLQITRALSEYAPGNQVVLNEKCYESSGIILKSEWTNARRAILQSCPNCGYSRLDSNILNDCPNCNSQGMTGIQAVDARFTDVIEPAGFSVDYFSLPKRIIKNNNGQKSTIEPILLNMAPWDINLEGNFNKIEIRSSSAESEILYYNKGNGFGYAICIHCGRSVPDYNVVDGLNPLISHRRLNGGRNNNDNNACTGNDNFGNGIKRNVLLGGRLHTDFVEIRFRNDLNRLISDTETIWSLGVILSRKLSEYLGINSQEINYGVKKYPTYSSIFIFDTAKGGAGYSTLFMQYSEEILNNSYDVLNLCNCEKACTACLIDRDSQWHLNNLDRKKAIEWLKLEKESRSVVPEALITMFPGTKRVTANLLSEVTQVLSNPEIKKITFFISAEVKEWKPENWKLSEFVKRLMLQGKEVDFAMYKPDLANISARELATVIEAKGLYQYKIISSTSSDHFPSLMHVEYANGEVLHYFSEKKSVEFSENWGMCDGPIYKGRFSPEYQYKQWNIDLSSLLNENKMVFEFKIKDRNTSLFNFHNTILQSEPNKWNKILLKIKNKKVKITYLDIYLKDALGCLMLVNLVKYFSKVFEFDIQSLHFDLSSFSNNFRYTANSNIIDKDWADSGLRTAFLKDASESILGIFPIVREDGFLPHWRELIFSSDEFELVIRPNGGIKNGWKLDNKEGSVSQDEIDYSEDFNLFNTNQRDGLLYNVVFESKNQ